MIKVNKYKTNEKIYNCLICAHIEMKLIQKSFTIVWSCIISVSFQCVYSLNV